jgi:hypothetical protein
MSEEQKKFNITLAPGQQEVIIRQGDAPIVLDPRAPVRVSISGTIQSPVEFLLKRIDQPNQVNQKLSHVIVNRDKISIQLVICENDEYTRGTVTGKLEFNQKFVEFGVNSGKVWSPFELAMFIKMNRSFFADKNVAMKLVSDLKNFKAKVNAKLEQGASEKGDRNDVFTQTVDSNLPESFSLQMPIFKGQPAETFDVETFASIDGREVGFTLLSPGANESMETLRDSVIDEQLKAIREIAPDIAIFEV